MDIVKVLKFGPDALIGQTLGYFVNEDVAKKHCEPQKTQWDTLRYVTISVVER